MKLRIAIAIPLALLLLVTSGITSASASDTSSSTRANPPSFQQASDIQSKRWQPSAWWATEIMITNSTNETLYVEGAWTNRTWAGTVPRSISPKQLVRFKATGRGVEIGFTLTARRESGSVAVVTKNYPLKSNEFFVTSKNSLITAAVDGWNNGWIPRANKEDYTTSATIGSSNWNVVAFDVGRQYDPFMPGSNLPRGEWSSSICSNYKSILGENLWGTSRKDWWQSGMAGAAAGAALGMITKNCQW